MSDRFPLLGHFRDSKVAVTGFQGHNGTISRATAVTDTFTVTTSVNLKRNRPL